MAQIFHKASTEFLFLFFSENILICFVSYETLLSIAAKLGDMNLFRYLVQKGAPISPVGAKYSPLFTGIRKKNLEIVSTMLSMGADPNQFMLNKNNKPYYPLDVAISKKFNEAITLLITFGANTNLVNKKRISDPAIKEMLDSMKLPQITIDNHPYHEIEKLKSRFLKIKSEILSFVQEIIDKPGCSTTAIINMINKIRKLFTSSTQFMVDLSPLTKELEELAQPLLNRQMELFNISRQQQPAQISSFQFNEGRKLPEDLEKEWNENRIKIAEFAFTIHSYNHLAEKAFTQINNLRTESIEYITNATNELNEEKKNISAEKTNPAFLRRIGLPETTADIISNNSATRTKIIDETLQCLSEYKLKCDELGATIIKTLRETAK